MFYLLIIIIIILFKGIVDFMLMDRSVLCKFFNNAEWLAKKTLWLEQLSKIILIFEKVFYKRIC